MTIKELRNRYKETQREMAERIGVSQAIVWKWENRDIKFVRDEVKEALEREYGIDFNRRVKASSMDFEIKEG